MSSLRYTTSNLLRRSSSWRDSLVLGKYSRDFLLIAALFGLSFFFFREVLRPAENEIILGADLFWLFRPLADFAFEAFRQGEWPLWNPYLFLGFPQYAEPQISTFYPVMWLVAWMPTGVAFGVLYAFHFGLTAAGGYVLVRQLQGRWAGALIAGIVLAFNGFMVSHLHAGHLPHLMTIAYLPWLLAAADWAVQRRSWAAAIIAGTPLGLAMLAGYAPFFPFLVAAVSLLMFWRAIMAWRRQGWRAAAWIIVQLALLGLFAGLLAAVQLLPTFELAQHSSRVAGADYEFASSLSMPFWNLLTLLLPDLYGAPLGDVFYWGAAPINAYWEFAIYAGILPLILAVMAGLIGPKAWRFWLLLALGGLLLALGPAGAIHRLLYDWLPGFGLFRVPARLGYFFILGVAVLAGLLFDRWSGLPPADRERWQPPLRRLLLSLALLLPLLILLSVMWQAVQTDLELSIQIGGITSQLVRFWLLSTAALALLLWGHTQARWRVAVLAIALLLVDFWGNGYKFVVLGDPTPEVGWLMADLSLPAERTDYRLMTRGLAENSGYFFNFYHVDGYDDFRTQTSLELSRRAVGDARIARLLGARYLLHGTDYEKPPIAPGWELLSQPAGVTIYERFDSQPRAFVTHQVLPAADPADSLRLLSDPQLDFTQVAVVQVVPNTACAIEPGDTTAAQIAITEYTPNRVVLQATVQTTAWLVLSDLYYPGWQATVSGQPAVIQPTNYGLRGLCLPAGSHTVRFEFQPPLLRYGLALSTLALFILLAAILFFWLAPRFTSRPNPLDAAPPAAES